ncbi:MAG: type 1 glutamine amidotransferase [Candidatus Aminicenantes bacterium]|nr:MAG: type 1 glutamine amidotransferase [Candidatus Aminicenantes bacterium]
MNENKVKVAIIDNSIDSSVYNPIEHWKDYLKVEWDSFKATQSLFPDIKNGYTHLLLTGSEASILERENWVYEEVEVIQEAVEKGLPILGSCYGHQLLAFALAGPSHLRRCIPPEVGWIPIQIKEESQLLGKKRCAFSFSLHFDEVVNLDDSFLVIASSEHCEIQAFQFKKKPFWGIQIHPEIDVSSATELLRKLASLGLETSSFYEEAMESRPQDSGLIHDIVRNFIKSERR